MSYIYVQSEENLWTVGHIQGDDFKPESDHASPEEAANRVAMLNGGGSHNKAPSHEQLAIGIIAAILIGDLDNAHNHVCAVNAARDIMDTVYKTEPE